MSGMCMLAADGCCCGCDDDDEGGELASSGLLSSSTFSLKLQGTMHSISSNSAWNGQDPACAMGTCESHHSTMLMPQSWDVLPHADVIPSLPGIRQLTAVLGPQMTVRTRPKPSQPIMCATRDVPAVHSEMSMQCCSKHAARARGKPTCCGLAGRDWPSCGAVVRATSNSRISATAACLMQRLHCICACCRVLAMHWHAAAVHA